MIKPDLYSIACHLRDAGFDGLVVRLPQHVVLLTGYLPVLGNSFCVITADPPQVRLVVPEDERDLVPGWVHDVETFTEETMGLISTTLPSVREPLERMLLAAGLERAVVGYEGGRAPIVASYTQIGIPDPNTIELYHALLPHATFRDATDALLSLASVKSEEVISCITEAAQVAYDGFLAARSAIQVGATEADVEGATVRMLLRSGYERHGAKQVLAHAHVMSGPRAALAFRAYNQTSGRQIERGDTVLVQLEVALDGHWAELTRTFFAGEATAFWTEAHRQCVQAQDAAMLAEQAGVHGSAVDAAARNVLDQAKLGQYFKHGLGHGVGFQAINHSAPPKLHPVSTDVLHTRMVHNMEPAVYVANNGGLRLNDNVVVREDGADMISSFIPRDLEFLVV